jgi:hypothetical protein
MCKELTDGCYRCEYAEKAWVKYRDSRPRALNDHARKAVLRQMRKREFIAGFIAGRES